MSLVKFAEALEALADDAELNLVPKAPVEKTPKPFDKIAASATLKDLGVELTEEELASPEAQRIVEKLAASRTPPTPLGEPSERRGTDYAAPRSAQEAYRTADRAFEDQLMGHRD